MSINQLEEGLLKVWWVPVLQFQLFNRFRCEIRFLVSWKMLLFVGISENNRMFRFRMKHSFSEHAAIGLLIYMDVGNAL